MGTCLIGVNLPRVEDVSSLGPQEVQPIAIVTVPRDAAAQRQGSS